MGSVPPPRLLSPIEFRARWVAGARTLDEIDPEFKRGRRRIAWTRVMTAVALVAGAVFVVAFLGALISGL